MIAILCEECFRSRARSTSPVRPRCSLHGRCAIPPRSYGAVPFLPERMERCPQRNLWVRFWICSTTKAIRWNESGRRWRIRVRTTTTFETMRDSPSTRTSCKPHDTIEGWTRRWAPWKRRDAPPMGVGRSVVGEDGYGNGGRCDHSDTRTTCISVRRGFDTNPFDAEVDGSLSIRTPPVALFSRRTSPRCVGRPFVFSRSKASGGACDDDRVVDFDRRGRAGGLDPSRTSDPLTQTRRRRTFVSCGWTGAHSTVSRCVGSRLVRFASGAVPVCPTRRTRYHPLPSEARPCQFDLRFGRGRFHVGVVAQSPHGALRVHITTRHPDRPICGSGSSQPPLPQVLLDRRKPRGKRPPGALRWGTGRDHVTAGIRFARTDGGGRERNPRPIRFGFLWLGFPFRSGRVPFPAVRRPRSTSRSKPRRKETNPRTCPSVRVLLDRTRKDATCRRLRTRGAPPRPRKAHERDGGGREGSRRTLDEAKAEGKERGWRR